MNSHELKLYGLIYFHLLVWLFCFFAWTIKKQKLALILLTVIFLFQCLPFHTIIEAKLKYIKENKRYFKKVENLRIPERLISEYQYFAESLNMSYDEFVELMSYLEYYETSVFPIGIVKDAYYSLEEKTYSNPLSPQGLIIMSFILNSFL